MSAEDALNDAERLTSGADDTDDDRGPSCDGCGGLLLDEPFEYDGASLCEDCAHERAFEAVEHEDGEPW